MRVVRVPVRRSTRRQFLGLATLGVGTLGGLAVPVRAEDPGGLYLGYGTEPAPGCDPTREDIEGPFYREDAPFRARLVEDGMPGRRLTVSGRVLDPACRPVPGAVVDVWQADHRGRYDNDDPRRPPAAGSFHLRGRLRAQDDGGYEVRTIHPGRYRIGRDRWRPAHLHVKLSAEGFRPLTTQLYFDGDPENETDPWYRASRSMTVTDRGDQGAATFDFVLERA